MIPGKERVMNDWDRKIREPLAADEAELPGPLREPPLWEQLTEMFRGRLRWLNVLTIVGGGACTVFAVVSVVYFFRAESVREMIAWAGGFGFGLIAATAGKIWFWMQMHTNTVTRGVKRVELQLARLSNQLKKP